MIISVIPSQSDTFVALRAFLLTVLPAATEVVKAQVNRVPEVKTENFVIMTPIRRDRLETNVDTLEDTFFTGSISGTTLTVDTLDYGTITIGNQLFGPTVLPNTTITGGTGPYTVSPAQSIPPGPLACGVKRALQPTKFLVQLDVHGPASADNAQIISTLFRDEFGVDAFTALNPNVTPLYADDPRQMPFINDQQQYEDRWIMEAFLQVNATVIIPQQFADSLNVELINVDASYPP